MSVIHTVRSHYFFCFLRLNKITHLHCLRGVHVPAFLVGNSTCFTLSLLTHLFTEIEKGRPLAPGFLSVIPTREAGTLVMSCAHPLEIAMAGLSQHLADPPKQGIIWVMWPTM